MSLLIFTLLVSVLLTLGAVGLASRDDDGLFGA
jgi:hypothetical protein